MAKPHSGVVKRIVLFGGDGLRVRDQMVLQPVRRLAQAGRLAVRAQFFMITPLIPGLRSSPDYVGRDAVPANLERQEQTDAGRRSRCVDNRWCAVAISVVPAVAVAVAVVVAVAMAATAMIVMANGLMWGASLTMLLASAMRLFRL